MGHLDIIEGNEFEDPDARSKVFKLLPHLQFLVGVDKDGNDAKSEEDGEEEEDLDDEDEADFDAEAAGDVSSDDLGEEEEEEEAQTSKGQKRKLEEGDSD